MIRRQVDGDLDLVAVDVAHLVGHPGDDQPAAEQPERNRGGQDHRDGHGDVSSKSVQDFGDDKSGAHGFLSCAACMRVEIASVVRQL